MAEEGRPGITGTLNVTLDDIQLHARGHIGYTFAIQHLLATDYFSRKVAELENVNAGKSRKESFFLEVVANATACVYTAVASLEAYANEFYFNRAVYLPGFREEVADQIWELFEKKKILEKFELALLLGNRPRLKRGEQPTQAITDLLALRDALTHFKPEWGNEEKGQKKHDKLSVRLANCFTPSPFFDSEKILFPYQWACHNCTEWAMKSCKNYVTAFETAAGISSEYKEIADRLTP